MYNIICYYLGESPHHSNLPISNSQYLGIGIVILFYLPDEVGDRRLRDDIREAREQGGLEETNDGVVATGEWRLATMDSWTPTSRRRQTKDDRKRRLESGGVEVDSGGWRSRELERREERTMGSWGNGGDFGTESQRQRVTESGE
ncbi:hypothetical protein HAX54_022670 [Datura stramonium]|uniref:Uncharacterized protein n=1 Tax=Datura stramonium TaxID=4076 RepID=A0ABS8S4V1_DATST|nr:hypothetical protein [Datura stramonium]